MFYVTSFTHIYKLECHFTGLHLSKIHFITKGIYFYFKNIENSFHYIEISTSMALIMVL